MLVLELAGAFTNCQNFESSEVKEDRTQYIFDINIPF